MLGRPERVVLCAQQPVCVVVCFLFQQKQELFEAFTKQLEAAINSAADKYREKQ